MHEEPLGLPWQMPPEQTNGDTHWLFSVHDVRQKPIGSQVYGLQLELAPPPQLPAPLQVPGGMSVEPEQDPGVQIAPAASLSQTPNVQVPVWPQMPGPVPQRPSGLPGPRLAQVPVPLTLQALQVGQLVTVQHTPSVQCPLAQSGSAMQGWPRPSAPQLPAVQTAGLTHSAGLAQVVRHAAVAALHT